MVGLVLIFLAASIFFVPRRRDPGVVAHKVKLGELREGVGCAHGSDSCDQSF